MNNPGHRIDGLSPSEKRQLLAGLLARQGRPADVYPLSYGQRALWSLHEAFPGSAAYNVSFAARLRAPIDGGLLRDTFQVLIDRHPALRTRIVSSGGDAAQHVEASVPMDHVEHEVRSWSRADVHDHLARETVRPFRLDRAPLLRTQLLSGAADGDVLFVAMHHIAGDFWSLGVLLDEFRQLCDGRLRAGRTSVLPPLRSSYADFVRWQSDLVAGAEGDRLWTYWKTELSGVEPLLHLPYDRRRPATQTFEGREHDFTIPHTLKDRLQDMARDGSTTLFVVLLAGFSSMLQRYTGQDQILMGVPVAGRSRAEFAPVVGYFVNLVAVRASFDGDPPFREFLARMREKTTGAIAHQDFPFPVLVDHLDCERDPARAPLIQAVVNMPRAHRLQSGMEMPFEPTVDGLSLRLGGVTLEQFPVDQRTSVFELSLTILDTADGGLSLRIQYNSDLFDAGTIERMAQQYDALLRDAVERPDTRISQLCLDAAATPRFSGDGSGDAVVQDRRCVSALIDEQCARAPDAIAIVDGVTTLTYADLAARSHAVARELRRRSVRAGSVVGICLPPIADLIVSIIGVLKAGAAYLPLDPGHPRTRTGQIILEAGVPVVISEDDVAETALPDGIPILRVTDCVDADLETETADLPEPDPDSLAYVIFTSGSTGAPKGVAVSRRSLMYSTAARRRYYSRSPEHFLLLSPPAFDSSIAGIFWTLATGGRLSIGGVGMQPPIDPAALAEDIAARGVTHTLCVPSLYGVLLEELARFGSGALTTVIVAGEPCPQSLVDRHYRLLPEVALFNEYGPTEATVWSTVYRCRAGEPRTHAPIGAAIPGARVYLLDAHLRPVANGVPGEIFISGPGVAQGYVNRPDLTARAFLPDLFVGAGNERMYRTGDRARCTNGRDLEFLGRIDEQLKIHGWRIEPAEIAAALRDHPAVTDAVVCPVEQPNGVSALAAYVQSEGVAAATLAQERVQHWQAVYDHSYARTDAYAASDPAMNLTIWTSSYTRAPLPEPEIVSSVDAVARRIIALRPRRVLEIGCGTGLLLSRLAPHCQEYLGCDFSEPALARARDVIAGLGLSHVRLERRGADKVDETGEFDAVVLNEVSQHFPGVEYLYRVLARAVRSVGSRGFVFVGGVRHLALLDAFHGSVEMQRSAAAATRGQLRQRIARQIAREDELFVHPDFFAALPTQIPEVSGVGVELKRGHAYNEITRFKFDAICYVDPTRSTEADEPLDWHAAGLDLDKLRSRLAMKPPALELRGIPNARLADEARLMAWLRGEGTAHTAGEIRDRDSAAAWIDPEHLASVGESFGYTVTLLWASSAWHFDAVFETTPGPIWRSAHTRPLELANDPLRPAREGLLISELRESLRQRLPAYMMPAHFVVMRSLPRGPNGKLDRRALPAPDDPAREEVEGGVAPRTDIECTLERIWAATLGLKAVGIRDSFFALGGDSILVIQMVGKARQAGINITPRQVFEHQTIEQLAALAVPLNPEVATPPLAGPVPLTAIQRWFFEQLPSRPGACCQAVLLEPASPLKTSDLEEALFALVRQHDALRIGFALRGETWEQRLEDAHPVVVRRVVSAVNEDSIANEVTAAVDSMDIGSPPLFRATLLDDVSGGLSRLLLVVHHLVVDAVSWHVLLSDLEAALERKALAVPPVSFTTWACELRQRAEHPAIVGEAEHRADGTAAMTLPPKETPPDAAGSASDVDELRVMLSAEDTARLFSSAAGVHGAALEHSLLSAVAYALRAWSGGRRLLIDLERHGRDDPDFDLSRTVGWLTAIVPVAIDLREADDILSIRREAGQRLQAIARERIGTGAARHRTQNEHGITHARLKTAHADVIVNYLGHVDRLHDASGRLRPAPEMDVVRSRLAVPGRYPLTVNAYVAGGHLRAEWVFRTQHFTRAQISQLADDFLSGLRMTCEAEHGGDPARDCVVANDPVETTYPLSSAQEGLLAYSVAEPASRAYVGQLGFRLDGPLDEGALQEAWAATVQRHPVLRTSCLWDSVSGPVQRVHDRVDTRVDVHDAAPSDSSGDAAVEMILAADRARGFDPALAPLTRLALVRVNPDRHWIVWSHHHLVLDGWSIPIVLADLFAHYRAALTRTRVVSPPPRPFRDYIRWVQRQDVGRARDFWRQAFAGWTRPQIDRTPGLQEDRGESTLGIDCRDLLAASRRQRVTLNTVVQAAWALVLGRRTRSRDVVFGVTSAGRPYDLEGADRMVGPFINTLPFRSAIPTGERVGTWLRGLQEIQVATRQFEYCPLADIRTWIGAPGPAPLFDTLIVFENYPLDALLTAELGNFGVGDLRFTAWNHYAVTLRVVPQADLLLLTLLYDRRAASDADAAAILSDVEATLSTLARSDEREVGSIEATIPWQAPSAEQIEARARLSAEAMLMASRRRIIPS